MSPCHCQCERVHLACYFLFPQTVCVPVAIKEDFRLADISLVKCGPEVRGPPLGQLRPFTASRSLSTLSRMPTLTPTCLLFEMHFQQLLSQWGLNMRQDVFWPFFKSEIFFCCWSAFQGCIFFSNMEPLWGEELGFRKVSVYWPVKKLQKSQLCSYFLTLAGSQVERKICWAKYI